MALICGTTVRIVKEPDESLNDRVIHAGSIGFINEVGKKQAGFERLYYVNLFEKSKLPQGILKVNCVIPEDCLKPDYSKSLKKAKNYYLNQVNKITQAYEERGRQYQKVVEHISKKYSISKNEVYAIYKAVLCFEDFYQSMIEN